MKIGKVGVIGAGTMGAGIAAHLAGAGVDVLLLDVVPSDATAEGQRSRLARDAIARLRKARPAPFMTSDSVSRVVPGNVEDDMKALGTCDWIIEAVTEDLDVKRDLYRRIAAVRQEHAIVSSNTSGLSLVLLTDGFDAGFQEHFLVTHFFNPPRYMYLLETVAGARTRADVIETIETFADVRLGKGVVRCKDTPNFIANRIGIFSMAASARFLEEEGLSIEEADAISGPPMGRPKTASFRLHDLVGLDVAVAVMENTRKLLPNDESRDLFVPPDFVLRLVKEGRLGQKTGAGFYTKDKSGIRVLDLETFEYREPRDVSYASLDAVRRERDVRKRLAALVSGDDAAARYAWKLLSDTLVYAARRIPEIADDVESVDRAMRWGFNWDLGPFEAWDAIGVTAAAERLRREGRDVPRIVTQLIDSGSETFYAVEGAQGQRRRVYFDFAEAKRVPVTERPGVLLLDDVRRNREPVLAAEGASTWDLGDGVLCVEFQSKMNSLSGSMLQLISSTIDLAEQEDYAGVVVGNQAPNFSVGANLAQLSEAAREKDFDAIEAMIRQFHSTVLRMRYSAKPVVVAVHGMALGGGCELALGGCRVQAAAETYIGLVELGVGLIPAGGGTREMACRASEVVPRHVNEDFFPHVLATFQAIAEAKTSTSGQDAAALGYLRPVDGISSNRDRTLADAKRTVRYLAESGYAPPPPRRQIRVAGRPGLAELRVRLRQYQAGGFVSDHDVLVAEKLAQVLCGGDIDPEHAVDEEYLLDLELETFLSLVGEEKTLERIAHTLKTGKPLRN